MANSGIKTDLHLREVTAPDLEEIARFIQRMSKSQTPISLAVERLTWILLENPARGLGDPLGWLLRAPNGEIVGCMFCAPQKFRAGSTEITAMMANSFYTDDAHRGSGASIFLKFLQLARRYPLFVSSANQTVAEMWRKLGGFPLANSDHEVIGVLRWPPLLEETAYRKITNPGIARLAAKLAAPFVSLRIRRVQRAAEGELRPLHSSEEVARLCADHHSDKITARRDAAFLEWRYFSHTAPATRLFAFSRGGEKQLMVAVRLQRRGYRRQIRALQVLDIWGEPDPPSCHAIAACLCREYRNQIDMLVFRCLTPAQQQVLVASGFRIRPFAAPIAWCIDKYGLLPKSDWYFVPADGDMFL